MQELAAHQGRLLASIDRQLDAQVASFGIHPGRTGLSNQEVVAAMSMLRCGHWVAIIAYCTCVHHIAQRAACLACIAHSAT
jgi:hypothetical protein